MMSSLHPDLFPTHRARGSSKAMRNEHAQAGLAVARARKILGLTQRELGEELGVKPLAVGRWESGHAEVPRARREAITLLMNATHPDAAQTLAQDFGLPAEFLEKRDARSLRGQVDLVVLRTADTLDIVPSLARRVARELVMRLAALNITIEEAQVLLDRDVK